MSVSTYRVNEVFLTLQGEGLRAGTVNTFVRFSGCNLQCKVEEGPLSPGGFDCDTEFVSGRTLSLDQLVTWIKEESGPCRNIIFTGGEPGLQLDKPLVEALHKEGFYLAVETNGTIDLSHLGLDWITLSPKVAEHAIRCLEASEIKYVRGYGQGIPKPKAKAQNYLLSPAFDGLRIDPKALDWCVNLCKEYPTWRLSIQTHKFLSIR